MFVIERVPLQLLEEVTCVHHLEDKDPVVGQQASAASRMAAGSALWAKTLLPVIRSTGPAFVAQGVDRLGTERPVRT